MIRLERLYGRNTKWKQKRGQFWRKRRKGMQKNKTTIKTNGRGDNRTEDKKRIFRPIRCAETDSQKKKTGLGGARLREQIDEGE